MEYVELIIDDEYVGIYCLQEVVDLDTFSANKKTDLLVSVKKWESEIEERELFTLTEQENDIIDEFELEKGLKNNRELRLELLKTAINKINNIEENAIQLEYDLENNAKYSVFINLIEAQDNTYKNEKILFRNMGSYYIMQKTPWDLDRSMQNERVTELADINRILEDDSLSVEFKESDEFKNMQKDIYFKLRETIYNEETLNQMVDKYAEYLKSSGAVERDSAKWANNNFEESCENIKKFFKERISILDNYYGEL
jgi:hypothetical protein